MNSCELVTLISSISCLIAEIATDEEIDLLSVLFTQLGDSLATISVNKSITGKKDKCRVEIKNIE